MILKKLWSRRIMIPLFGLAIVLIVARTSNPPIDPKVGMPDYTPYNPPYRVTMTGFSANTLATLPNPDKNPVNLNHDSDGTLYFAHTNKIYSFNPSTQAQPQPLKLKFDTFEEERFKPGFLTIDQSKSLSLLSADGYRRVSSDGKPEFLQSLYFFSRSTTMRPQIAVDIYQNAYVTRPNFGEIWRITPNGNSSRWFTLPSIPNPTVPKSYTEPMIAKATAIAYDPETHSIYAYDAFAELIHAIMIRADGSADSPYSLLSTSSKKIGAMTVDSSGRLLMLEDRGLDSGLWRVDRDGTANLLVRGLGVPISLTAIENTIYVMDEITDPQTKAISRTIKAITQTSTATETPTQCLQLNGNTSYGFGTFYDLESRNYWVRREDDRRYPSFVNSSQILENDFNQPYRTYITLRKNESNTAQLQGDLIWVRDYRQAQFYRVEYLVRDITFSPKTPNVTFSPDGNKVAWIGLTDRGTTLNVVDIATKKRKEQLLAVPSRIKWLGDKIITVSENQDQPNSNFTLHDTNSLAVVSTWQAEKDMRMIYSDPTKSTWQAEKDAQLIYSNSGLAYIETASNGQYKLVYTSFDTGKPLKIDLPDLPSTLEKVGIRLSPKGRFVVVESPTLIGYRSPDRTLISSVYLLDTETGKSYREKVGILAWSPDETSVYFLNDDSCTLRRMDAATSTFSILKEKAVVAYFNEYISWMFVRPLRNGEACVSRREQSSTKMENILFFDLQTGSLHPLLRDGEQLYPEGEKGYWDTRLEPMVFATTQGLAVFSRNSMETLHKDMWQFLDLKSFGANWSFNEQWAYGYFTMNSDHAGDVYQYALNFKNAKLIDIRETIERGSKSILDNPLANIGGLMPANRANRVVIRSIFAIEKNTYPYTKTQHELGLLDLDTNEYRILLTLEDVDSSIPYPSIVWSPDDEYFTFAYGKRQGAWYTFRTAIFQKDGTLLAQPIQSYSDARDTIGDNYTRFGACPR